MKNTYDELKDRHHKESNAFPLGACFSNQQFTEMMQRWGFTPNDTDKILSVGYGCYIRKSDRTAFREMIDRHNFEHTEAIANDKTGDGYIYDMFLSELANHEYCITYEYEETFDALGLTFDEVNSDKRLLHGLKKAQKQYLKHCHG